eukprot:9249322-Pyramimonas_sp.AAC.1
MTKHKRRTFCKRAAVRVWFLHQQDPGRSSGCLTVTFTCRLRKQRGPDHERASAHFPQPFRSIKNGLQDTARIPEPPTKCEAIVFGDVDDCWSLPGRSADGLH